MKKLLVFCFVVIFLMMAAGVRAEDGGIVKWSQPPDMDYGVNIKSTEVEPIVADDWKCEDPRPIVDVHFWGSYIGWEKENPGDPFPPHPVIDAFIIRIYKDVPAGADPDFPYSHPGDLIYEKKVTDFEERYYGTISHPDETYEHKFYYSLDLPEPFLQGEGSIYWISIAAVMPDVTFPWGWETSTKHWNDNACRYWFYNNYWEEILPSQLPRWYQEYYETVDMAFELTVKFEPPPPLEPIKWQQRPDMEQGVNIVSIPPIIVSQNPLNGPVTVADDWLCLDASPLSDLHFWGSYPGWEELNPGPPVTRPPGVEAFRIQVYSDAPVPNPLGYSHPGNLLYEVWVKDFTETYVASIFHFWEEKYEHKYRYDLELPRIFWQKRDRIYWLNISAIPAGKYPWGWESSMDRWNDFAVSGYYFGPDDWFWELIYHPWTKKPIDMSFELTTCEGPIKWLQFPDMANGFNILSLPMDPVVADDWLCTKGKPITEIYFWGSYLSCDEQVHWGQDKPEPPLPTPGLSAFRISFHKNVPAGVDPDMPWSHPGELIKEIGVDFENVKERYWDSVSHESPEGLIWWEHKFYYIIRLEEPFRQEEGNVYWLNIGAKPLPESRWCWGWETSKDHWNDNAVAGWKEGTWWKELSTIDFEDLILGTTYNCCGYKFTTSGIPVTLKAFQWSGGGWTTDGSATVQDGGQAGGSGNEMWVNNVNLDFGFGVSLTGLSLLFGEYGGNVNIEINGDFRNFENFVDINGLTIGGVKVSVVNGHGNDKRSLTLTGTINQFAIGGQELAIDNVKSTSRIDMAFALITKDDTDYCEGDFDRDGDVDGSDLAVFAADFGRTDCYFTGDCEGDFDYNSKVDVSDLAIFAADFGRTDCPCALPVH